MAAMHNHVETENKNLPYNDKAETENPLPYRKQKMKAEDGSFI